MSRLTAAPLSFRVDCDGFINAVPGTKRDGFPGTTVATVAIEAPVDRSILGVARHPDAGTFRPKASGVMKRADQLAGAAGITAILIPDDIHDVGSFFGF
jgi:hypothetical protein